MKQSFGQILKQTRQLKGLSQRELATKVGVDFTYVSKLENDRLAPPAADTIIKFAKILDAPQEVLLASCGKLDEEVTEAISSSPESIRFLTELKEMKLTTDEWDKLMVNLKNLR